MWRTGLQIESETSNTLSSRLVMAAVRTSVSAFSPTNPLWHDQAAEMGVEPSHTDDRWMDQEEEEHCRSFFADFELVD